MVTMYDEKILETAKTVKRSFTIPIKRAVIKNTTKSFIRGLRQFDILENEMGGSKSYIY